MSASLQASSTWSRLSLRSEQEARPTLRRWARPRGPAGVPQESAGSTAAAAVAARNVRRELRVTIMGPLAFFLWTGAARAAASPRLRFLVRAGPRGASQGGGQGALELEPAAGGRMDEAQPVRMKPIARVTRQARLRSGHAAGDLEGIADERMARRGQVYPDLVGPPGRYRRLHDGVPAAFRQHANMRDRGLALPRGRVDATQPGVGDQADRGLDGKRGPDGDPGHERAIHLLELAVAPRGGNGAARLGR